MDRPTRLPAKQRAQLERGDGLAFPAGVFGIDRTITLPWGRVGQRVAGQGNHPTSPLNTGYTGGTILVWTGEPGGTLLQARGTVGLTLGGLTLLGPAGTLLAGCNAPESGFGHLSVRNVSFVGADAGVRMGEHVSNTNCDNTRWEACIWIGCQAGFQSLNHQSVNHSFDSCRFYDCRTAWDIQAGGNVHAYGAGSVQQCDRLARFGDGGPNNAVSSFAGLRVEGPLRVSLGSYRQCSLVDVMQAEPWGPCELTCHDTSTFDVRGGSMLPQARPNLPASP